MAALRSERRREDFDHKFARAEQRLALLSSNGGVGEVRRSSRSAFLRPIAELAPRGALRIRETPRFAGKRPSELGHHVHPRRARPVAEDRPHRPQSADPPACVGVGRHAVLQALPPAVAEYEIAHPPGRRCARSASSAELPPRAARCSRTSADSFAQAASAYQKSVRSEPPRDPGRCSIAGSRFGAGEGSGSRPRWPRDSSPPGRARPPTTSSCSSEGGVGAEGLPHLVRGVRGGAARPAHPSARQRKQKTEFAEDLVEFQRRAVEKNRKRIDARLADAELLLRTQDPNARLCSDAGSADRLAQAEAARAKALAGAARPPGRERHRPRRPRCSSGCAAGTPHQTCERRRVRPSRALPPP